MDTIPSFQSLIGITKDDDDNISKSQDFTEQIDDIFEVPIVSSEEFRLQDILSDTPEPSSSANWLAAYKDDGIPFVAGGLRRNPSDIDDHLSETFPHVHHPLRHSHHHRHRSRKRTHKHSTSEDTATAETSPREAEIPSIGINEDQSVKFEVGDTSLQEGWSTHEAISQEDKNRVIALSGNDTGQDEEEDFQEGSPLLKEVSSTSRLKPCIKAAEEAVPSDEESRKKSKVQFDVETGLAEEDTESANRDRHSRKSKRSRRHHNIVEDPSLRRHPGSEHVIPTVKRLLSEEESKILDQHDLDDLTSHRFEDPSGLRRQRVRSSVSSIIHLGSKFQGKSSRVLPVMKKTYDHNPHEIFVELAELKSTGEGYEWKETARWIKYEEDVEGADNRWGKPHIAILNFHSLFSLRQGLQRGAVLLDLEEKELPNIAARVVDCMVQHDQIPADQRDAVIKVLLLRHKHMKDSQSSFRRPSRGSKSRLNSGSEDKLSSSQNSVSADQNGEVHRKGSGITNFFHVNSLPSFKRHSTTEDAITKTINGDLSAKENGLSSRKLSYTQIDMDSEHETKKKKDIMKKIPDGAEATAVLVGAVDFLKQPTIAFVRLAEGVLMDNIIEVSIPVRFMFVLLGPFDGDMDYHEVGRSISTLMSDKGFHEVAYRAHSRSQLLSAINEFLNASIVLPPSDWNNKDLVPIDEIRAKGQEIQKKNENMRAKKRMRSTTDVPAVGSGDDGKPPPRDPLKRHGKLFYGLIEDAKCRFPKYPSDIKDGLSPQVFSAAIFIFFAALSAAITFGGMYGDQTKNLIGVGECLLVSAINGMIFSLLSCQPLLIVGATGPLMIFDMSLYMFCKSNDLEFLPMRVWIGVWMTVTGLLFACFEAIALVKKFTRFTEEIFSMLVCLIFIYGAFDKLGGIYKEHPLKKSYCYESENHTEIVNATIVDGVFVNGTLADGTEVTEGHVPQPNTALLSTILMIGTFIIAIKLKYFRNSKFLGRSVRRALGDFGVPISIIIMVAIDYFIKDTYTDKLEMPDGLQPSNPAVRGWIINPFGMEKSLPVWCIFATAPASLLLFILIFLEENICHLILSKPEKQMKKGSGFHWDLVLSCAINFVSGIMGAPFMGPACVRTVSHTSALTIMSNTQAPGESPKVIGVLEQRVSSFVVSLLVGLAVFLAPALTLVPKAVLFGIFLYMGISAMAGINFLDRTILFFMPVKHHPNVPYVKKVRTWKMHIFTAIQLLMLAILWIVKQSPAALCFPFVLMLLIPLRLYLLPHIFTTVELQALDGKEEAGTRLAEDEPDFFEEIHDIGNQIEGEGEEHNHQQ